MPIAADVRAIFFDAVGTLIHPEPSAPLVYAEVGRRHGSLLDPGTIAVRFRNAFQRQEEIDRSAGWQTSEAREIARWQCIVAEVLHDAEDTAACFAELFAHFGRPEAWLVAPGAASVLSALARRGYALGIASNFDRRLRSVVAGIPELAVLPYTVISSEIGWRKPAREFFTAVCKRVGLAPSHVLLVGDDWVNDYEGARSAGLHAIVLNPAMPINVTRIQKLGDLLD